MLSVRWITTRDEFAGLAPAWDAALEASGSDNPFLLADFLLVWLDAFLPGGRLRVFTLWAGERLVGGLPLYPDRRRHGTLAGRGPKWAALRMIGLGSTNLTEPFSAVPWGEFAGACLEALGALRGWTYLSLPLARAPWWESAGADGGRRFAYIAARNQRAACVRVDRPADEYLQTLHSKMRSNIRRDLRRAEAMGTVELRRAEAAAEVEEMIAFQLRHNGPDRYEADEDLNAPRATWAEYTRTMLRHFFAQGRLDAMGLRIGGELAAAGFGIRHGAGFKSLLISYDPRFARCGPGMVLRYKIIEWCWRNGDPLLHMYGEGADPHKASWCHEFVPMHRLWLFNRNPAGRLLYWGTRWRKPEPAEA